MVLGAIINKTRTRHPRQRERRRVDAEWIAFVAIRPRHGRQLGMIPAAVHAPDYFAG
jgi:hypothetical protein